MLGLGNTLSGGIVPEAATPYANEKSVAFDGSNDYMSIGSIDWDMFSLVLWFKTTSGTNSKVFGKDPTMYFSTRLIGGESGFHMHHPATGVQADTFSKDVQDGNWHMLTLTHSGGSGSSSTTILYIDGAEEESYTQTNTYTTTTNTGSFGAGFGDSDAGPYNPWAGSIDEIGVWKDTVLDGDAVSALYNSGKPIDLSSDSGNYDNSGDLTHWWRMGDGDTFATITDNKGSVDGTLTNMASGDIETNVP